MLNRAIQVKMVKNDENEPPQSNTTDQFDDKALTIGAHLQNVIRTVGTLVIGYVAVDTVRQVMVEKAKK